MKKKLLVVLLCLLFTAFGALTVLSSDLAARCDIDGDGSVTVLDALIVLRYITDGDGAPDEPAATQATIVLTATDKVNALNGTPLAEKDHVQFRILNEFGQLGGVSYTCPKSALGITDSAESLLFHSYNVKTSDDFATFDEVKKVEAVKAESVSPAEGGITVNGTTYVLAEQFSSDRDRPELIVRSENNGYALLYCVTSNACPELLLFDDDGDGTPDRGLYRDYQFGQYKSTFEITDADGKNTRTVLIAPTVIGEDIKIGDRIVYSYNETADILYVKEVAQTVSGVVSGLNADTCRITIGGLKYIFGFVNLPGAWTYQDTVTTNLLGKSIDLYLVGGRGVYFEESVESSAMIVYADKDTALVDSRSVNVGNNSWAFTYSNAIDVVNGGLLPYNIVCYNVPLRTGTFYRIRNGVVVSEVKALDVAAAEREMADARASGENLLLSETVAYQAATTDENGNVYLYKFPAGYGLSANNIDTTNQTCTVFFPSTAYVGTPAVSYSNVSFIGYTLTENDIQNTAADSVTPKDFSGDAAYLNALRTKGQYIFNYLGIRGSTVGDAATPNLVVIADYTITIMTHFKRQYKSITDETNPTVTVDNPDAFVEYIVFRTSNISETTPWDNLRKAIGASAYGDVNVTNALKLFAADGTFVDPVKYGLTYTVKDNLINAYTDKQSFLEIRRDPMNKEVLPAADNYYMTFELNGYTYLIDKVTISLLGSEVWYDGPACIIKTITASSHGNEFTLFVDLGATQLSDRSDLWSLIDRIETAFDNMNLTLYKKDPATDTYNKVSDIIRLVKSVNIYGTEFAFTLEAHEIFTSGDYAFELSFPDEPLNLNHAIEFTVA